ncbi:MAG TPA: HD domain-containing phosphohydrolase [Candidatus Desulfaltia sp.]|nr:HD domain-containing phosphohydrolase [Candidatus Desulfaltia sp.]
MERSAITIIDEDPGRKDRTAQFLARMALDVRTVGSLSAFLAEKNNPEMPAIAVVSLVRLTAARTDLLRRVRKTFPQVSLIVLFRPEDSDAGITLLHQGLVDQIAGPDNWGSLYSAVKNELARKKLLRENADYDRHLKLLGQEKARNRNKALELEEIHTATLENLMTALDLRDVETFGHSITVAKYCQTLAKLVGITDEGALVNIRKGALLHDIGKIAIPDAILKKPDPLSAAEWEKIKLHPVLGYGLIREIKLVKEVGHVILYHHEKYDGSGYPKGLKGEAIPLEARMFSLADALDAITSHRPYRKERDFETARKEILDNRQSQFDPMVVDAFCSLGLEEWEKIRYETTKIMPAMETFSELFSKPPE